MTDPVILFVARDSIYKSMGFDCYDEERDARTYPGDSPVVAHPPCQTWVKFARINYRRWGGEHNRPGNDGGCFKFALDTVNRYGGVLEHPAESYAWNGHGLPSPGLQWTRWKNGWVCEVWQSVYGHPARKRTWIYCSKTGKPISPKWTRKPGTHQIGRHGMDGRPKEINKPTLDKKASNDTPLEFALWLIELARGCAP